MTPAANLANYVAEKFVKTVPPDLTALCRDLGLRIREVPAKGFDGALIRSKAGQKGIVAVKASIFEKSRKRFTIAHEIGHFIIPHHRDLGNICEDRKIESFDSHLNQAEIEANEFAAELLLPSALLRKRFNLSEFSLPQISAVATDFGTSLTATIRSFLTLTDLPCAMVWSVTNSARWFVRSDSFRFFLPLPELPANGSFAARIFKGEAAPTELAPVRPDVWLDRQAAEHVNTLLEHSISLPNYNAVLTLLWAYKAEPLPARHGQEALLEDLDPQDFTLNRRRWPR
jgi:IrrE N-terminal-like domain